MPPVDGEGSEHVEAAPAVETPAVETPAAEAAPAAPEAGKSAIESAEVEVPAVEESTPEGAGASEAAPADEAGVVEPKAAEGAEEQPVALAAEAAGEGAAPEPVAYEPFTFPEGFTAPDDKIAEFSALIGGHQVPQETAQKLIDLHVQMARDMQAQMAQNQYDVFAQTRAGWLRDLDKQYGPRRPAVVESAKRAVMAAFADANGRFGEKAQAALKATWAALDYTGAGDNPHVITAFANLHRRLSERQAPTPSVPMNRASISKPDARYGNGAQS